MVKRIPLLAGAVKVTLPDRAGAGRAARRNREGRHTSTFEAVAQALGVIEGPAAAGPLLEFHRRATDRLLLVRGKFRPEDVYRDFGGPVRAAEPSRPNEPTSRNH